MPLFFGHGYGVHSMRREDLVFGKMPISSRFCDLKLTRPAFMRNLRCGFGSSGRGTTRLTRATRPMNGFMTFCACCAGGLNILSLWEG